MEFAGGVGFHRFNRFFDELFFFNDVDSISILKKRESIFSSIYFSTHLKPD